MSQKKEELSLEEQVARIRAKRSKGNKYLKARGVLNTVFLVLAGIGVVWYFCTEEQKLWALGVVAFAMFLKVIEFILRFMF